MFQSPISVGGHALRIAVIGALAGCAAVASAQTPTPTPPPVNPQLSGQQQFGTRPDAAQVTTGSFAIPPVMERPSEFDEAAPQPYVVRKFQLVGAQDRPGDDISVADIQSRLLDPMVAKQPAEGYTLSQMEQIVSNVTKHYQQRGFITTQAFIPAQDVTDGVVKVQVLEGRLGNVWANGNELYSTKTLEMSFAPLEGEPIQRDDLTSALLRLEQKYPGFTPGARTLQPGRTVGTSDLVIDVQKEQRFEFDLAADNWGTESSGEYRPQFGMAVNNLFGRADQLRLYGIYAFDPSDSDRSNVYGGIGYEIAVTARNRLSASYSTNSIDLRSDIQDFVPTKGTSEIADLFWRWQGPLTTLSDFTLGAGVSHKTASFEFVGGGGKFAEDNLTVLVLDGNFLRIEARERFGAINTLYASLSHGDYDPDQTIPPSRAEALYTFDKYLVNYQRLQRLGKTSDLLIRLSGQYSDDVLVSLEQLSLGGPDTVRAYSAAERLADTGAFASLEWILHAPGFDERPAFGGHKWGDVLQFSLYFDYGYGELNEPTTTDVDFDLEKYDLAGWGGALQLAVPDGIYLRLDVATPITDVCDNVVSTYGECVNPANDRDPQYWFRLGYAF